MTTAVTPIVGPQAQNSVVTISKARIKKGLLYAEFTEQLTLEDPASNFTMQGKHLIHEDLVNAIATLVPHFVSLTEQLPATHTDEDLQKFEVSGFSISNKGGVTLSGHRTLTSEDVLNLTAPFVSFDEEQAPKYEGWEELEKDMARVLEEVEAAMRGKRSDASRQLDAFQEAARIEELNDAK